MITIRQVEDMGLIIEELSALHRMHWDESGESGEFAYRYDILRRMWEQNMVRCYGLFDGDRLVGHATVYVLVDMRTGKPTAEDQALYVLPAYRGRYGAVLWRYGMRCLEAEGVTKLSITCALGNIAGRMALKMGFAHVANRYIKQLGKTHEARRTSSS